MDQSHTRGLLILHVPNSTMFSSTMIPMSPNLYSVLYRGIIIRYFIFSVCRMLSRIHSFYSNICQEWGEVLRIVITSVLMRCWRPKCQDVGITSKFCLRCNLILVMFALLPFPENSMVQKQSYRWMRLVRQMYEKIGQQISYAKRDEKR